MRRAPVVVGSMLTLITAGSALAVPPTLTSVAQQQRHPVATFFAPRSDSATIYLASKPDRATDGSFLTENIEEVDLLTDSEVQSGRWFDENRVDPGTYWVMLRAYPDFDSCYVGGAETYDPACANGFSNVLTLVIPKPVTRYRASVTAYRYSGSVYLELAATPLGEKVPYRACYRLRTRRVRCVGGVLDGYSWDSSASDSLTVSTRGLPNVATFIWYVGGKRVAMKRVRVR